MPFDVRTIDPEPPAPHEALRAMRKSRGLEVGWAAEQMGLTQSALSNYELGYRVPQPLAIRKLAAFYGIDPRELRALFDDHKAWQDDNKEKLQRLGDSVVVVVGKPAVLRLLTAVEQHADEEIDKLVAFAERGAVPVPHDRRVFVVRTSTPKPPARPAPKRRPDEGAAELPLTWATPALRGSCGLRYSGLVTRS